MLGKLSSATTLRCVRHHPHTNTSVELILTLEVYSQMFLLGKCLVLMRLWAKLCRNTGRITIATSPCSVPTSLSKAGLEGLCKAPVFQQQQVAKIPSGGTLNNVSPRQVHNADQSRFHQSALGGGEPMSLLNFLLYLLYVF